MEERDQKAEALINTFMTALMIEDFEESARTVFPMVHKSNYNPEQDSLSNDLLRFSFNKANSNAKYYVHPVEITRTLTLENNSIGYPSYDGYEKGQTVKYWIKKKNGIKGMPAPVNVFFPADGGGPSIAYMGSI